MARFFTFGYDEFSELYQQKPARRTKDNGGSPGSFRGRGLSPQSLQDQHGRLLTNQA